MQILGEVREGSGADAEVRFRKVHTYLRLRLGKKVTKVQALEFFSWENTSFNGKF